MVVVGRLVVLDDVLPLDDVVDPLEVVGRLTRGVVRVVELLRGVVDDDGLFAVLVAGFVLGRLVVPPPIVPPPLAGSCCAIATLAVANTHANAEREIRGSRRRVDIRFSPAKSDCD